jgi:hypothetical protein
MPSWAANVTLFQTFVHKIHANNLLSIEQNVIVYSIKDKL